MIGNIPTQFQVPRTSVGKLLANCEARLLDVQTGKEISRGIPGLLWLRTPGICQGYLDTSTNTVNGVTKDGWYNTGDVGYVDEAGNWFIMGRKEVSQLIFQIERSLKYGLIVTVWE